MGKKARLKRLRATQNTSDGCPFCGFELETHHSTYPEHKKFYKCGTPFNLRCRGLNCRLSVIEDSLALLMCIIEETVPTEVIENAKTRKKQEEDEEMPMVPMPRILRSSS